MNINYQLLNHQNDNYLQVIHLYKEAFTTAKNIPTWFLKFKLRNGKEGFNIVYNGNTWIGLLYITKHLDIILVHFIAISESKRSSGYGSLIIDSMKTIHADKRIVLNIEKLDVREPNYQQRVKRKDFYKKNGFCSSGYFVKEPGEELEMLIFGGTINKEEIEAMYKELFGGFLSAFIRPKIIKI